MGSELVRPLSFAERSERDRQTEIILDSLERIEEEGLRIGRALLVIQSKRLYREQGTWAQFCADLLGRSRHKGYRLIKLARVTANLEEMSHRRDIQISEKIAEELHALPKELQLTAYESAGGDGASSEAVRRAREILEKLERGDRLTDDEIETLDRYDKQKRGEGEAAIRIGPVDRGYRLLERMSRLYDRVDPADLPQLGRLQCELLRDLANRLPNGARANDLLDQFKQELAAAGQGD